MLRDFITNNQITIYGDGSIRRNFLYVEDVAKMIGEVAFDSKQNRLINLIGFHPTSIRELADKIQLLVPENKAIIKELNLTVPSSDHDFDTTLLNSIFPNFKFLPIINGLDNELKFIKSGIS
jgi:UDP-glucose 4-epimerase